MVTHRTSHLSMRMSLVRQGLPALALLILIACSREPAI
jgi:hypothetical protein